MSNNQSKWDHKNLIALPLLGGGLQSALGAIPPDKYTCAPQRTAADNDIEPLCEPYPTAASRATLLMRDGTPSGEFLMRRQVLYSGSARAPGAAKYAALQADEDAAGKRLPAPSSRWPRLRAFSTRHAGLLRFLGGAA